MLPRLKRVLAAAALAASVAPPAAADPRGIIDALFGRVADLDAYEWSLVTDRAPWAARAGLQAVELRDRVFVLGGRTPLDPAVSPVPGASQIWGDVWASDDQGASWKQLAGNAAWPARAYFQAVTKDGAIFVLGGQNFKVEPNPCPPGVPGCPPFVSRSDFFNDVWRSRDGVHWTQLTANAGWTGRAGLSAVVLRDAIYVLGGSKNDDSAVIGGPPARIYFNDVWKSRDGRNWERVTEHAPWAPRAGAVAIEKDGWIYLLGGEEGFICDNPAKPCPPYFNDVWRSRDGRQWEQVTAAAGWSPRPGHQCAVLLRQFVCFGGFGLPPAPTAPAANPVDIWSSDDGAHWERLAGAPWNAATPDAIKYDFDVLVVRGEGRRPWPRLLTFGGDRETFNFADPFNYLRVDRDVWQFAPRRGWWRW